MKAGAPTIGTVAPAHRARLRAIAAPAMRPGSLRRRWPAFAAFALMLATLEAIRLWSTGQPRGFGAAVRAGDDAFPERELEVVVAVRTRS